MAPAGVASVLPTVMTGLCPGMTRGIISRHHGGRPKHRHAAGADGYLPGRDLSRERGDRAGLGGGPHCPPPARGSVPSSVPHRLPSSLYRSNSVSRRPEPTARLRSAARIIEHHIDERGSSPTGSGTGPPRCPATATAPASPNLNRQSRRHELLYQQALRLPCLKTAVI